LIVLSSLPVKGFLGTGATFEADLNLVLQLVMGAALLAVALLTKQKRYRAHGICQTTVLLLNLWMIGLVMWPAFRRQGNPTIPRLLHKLYYAVPMVHAAPGMEAELLGLYIALVAGTNVLPTRLRFRS
jgi:Ca2+/H+ antiporter